MHLALEAVDLLSSKSFIALSRRFPNTTQWHPCNRTTTSAWTSSALSFPSDRSSVNWLTSAPECRPCRNFSFTTSWVNLSLLTGTSFARCFCDSHAHSAWDGSNFHAPRRRLHSSLICGYSSFCTSSSSSSSCFTSAPLPKLVRNTCSMSSSVARSSSVVPCTRSFVTTGSSPPPPPPPLRLRERLGPGDGISAGLEPPPCFFRRRSAGLDDLVEADLIERFRFEAALLETDLDEAALVGAARVEAAPVEAAVDEGGLVDEVAVDGASLGRRRIRAGASLSDTGDTERLEHDSWSGHGLLASGLLTAALLNAKRAAAL
mmetsp:Transcript_10195/g.28742  ORF Transcript_10195/g.28742 Transcript_10195/m.28742 type:complete len:318 (+) Transcript_10195:411-1364(+)